MGEVPEGLRRGLRRVLIAAASRDGKGMVDGIREVGVLLPSADTAELERAMTKLFARFGGMGFAELQEVDPREFRAVRDRVRRRRALAAVPVPRELPAHHPRDVADLGHVQLARPRVQHLGCRRAVRRSADPPRGRQRRAGVREAGCLGRRAPSRGFRSGSTTSRRGSRRAGSRCRTRGSSVASAASSARVGGSSRRSLFAALFIGGILLRRRRRRLRHGAHRAVGAAAAARSARGVDRAARTVARGRAVQRRGARMPNPVTRRVGGG